MPPQNPNPNGSTWLAAIQKAIEGLESADSGASIKNAPWWEALVNVLEATLHASETLALGLLANLTLLILNNIRPLRSGLVDLSPPRLQLLARALKKWVELRIQWAATTADAETQTLMRTLGGDTEPEAPLGRATSQVTDMEKYLPLFVEETEEGLAIIQKHLLELETGVKKSGFLAPRALIDELFRSAHKLKASAAAMGFSRLAEMTHSLETVLDRVRAGALRASPDLVSCMLAVLDKVRSEIQVAKEGKVPDGDMMEERAALMWYIDSPPAIDQIPEAHQAAPTSEPASTLTPPPSLKETEPKSVSPSTTTQNIRVSVSRLDDLLSLSGELSHAKNGFLSVSQNMRSLAFQRMPLGHQGEKIAAALDEAVGQLSHLISGIQQTVLDLRMVPIAPLFERCRRVVRDIAQELGKEVDLVLQGGETSLDKKIVDQLGDPLLHMMRNAVDHGLEAPSVRIQAGKPSHGTITLKAERAGSRICVSVEDDGTGLHLEEIRQKAVMQSLVSAEEAAKMSAPELVPFIFQAGFSTATAVTQFSGRGVGMDIVRKQIEEMSGTIAVETEPGRRTIFRISLPLTVASQNSLIFDVHGVAFAFPLLNISEIVQALPSEITDTGFGKFLQLRDTLLPVFRIKHFFKNTPFKHSVGHRKTLPIVVVHAGKQRIGLIVDEIRGEEDVLIKNAGELLGEIPGIAGVSVLSSGDVALILDVETLMERSALEMKETQAVPQHSSNG